MIRALIKTRIGYLFSSLFQGTNLNKKRGPGYKLLFGLIALYIVGAIAVTVGGLFYSVLEPFYSLGLGWLYFSFIGIMVVGIGVVGSVFSTQSMLYEARDNDLLLSMPIPAYAILGSRMLVLLLLNYALEAIIVIPGAVVYGMKYPISLEGALIYIVIALFLPFMIMAICSLVGGMLAFISSKLPYKKLIIMALSLGLMIGYFVVVSKAQDYLMTLMTRGETLAEAVRQTVLPAYYMGIAIANHDVKGMLFLIAFCIVPFVLVYGLLSVFFIKIITTKRGEARIKYKEKALQVSSARIAMMKKEISRFLSSPMYMLNAGMGLIFMILICILLIYDKDQLTEVLYIIPDFENMMGPLLVVLLCYCSSMNFISAPSVSLEGKNLWIAQSLPVSGGDVLISKGLAHIAVSTPILLVVGTIINAVIKPEPLYMVLMYVAPMVITVFTGFLGVVINIHLPKFDWVNEAVAVKGSASGMISMFGSMAILLIPSVVYVRFLMEIVSMGTYIIVLSVVFVLISIGLCYYLKTKGKAMFEAL